MNTNDPQLCIVIPTKNEKGYIEKLLLSLEKQSYLANHNVPIFVADAHSTDGTRELISEMSQHLNVHLIDGGLPGIGRNNGAKLAPSELVLFIDADIELIDPTLIVRAVRKIKDEELDCLGTNVVCEGSFGERLSHQVGNIFHRLSTFWHPAATTQFLMFDRQAFWNLGGFDEKLLAFEDMFLTRKVRKNRFAILQGSVLTTNRKVKQLGYYELVKGKLILLYNFIINNPRYYYTDRNYWDS